MYRRFFFGIILLGIVSFTSLAIDFSKVNIAWQYNPTFDVAMKHRVYQDEGGLHVFLHIKTASLSNWDYSFLVQNSYESETHDTLNFLHLDTLLHSENSVLVRLNLSNIEKSLLVLRFSKKEKIYYYDINLKIGNFSASSIYPMDKNGMPLLKNFISQSGTSFARNTSFLVTKYKDIFLPADPPMADMKPLFPQIISDTTFVVTDVFSLEENNFYTVLKDSLATRGVTVLRVPPYFPKYRYLNELVETMLYLTNEKEKETLLKSQNLRHSFDSFWITTYLTKAKARKSLRNYYKKIETVNKLFTDFKPGWKTDRGMMYVVFGLPAEVYRTKNSEVWHYNNETRFEFTIISSFFAPQTYSLRRKKEYESLWYKQITTLRENINE